MLHTVIALGDAVGHDIKSQQSPFFIHNIETYIKLLDVLSCSYEN